MARVEFRTDNVVLDNVPEGTRIIDLCNEHNLSLPFGCRDGICGTCILDVISGELGPINDTEKDTLEKLGCRPGQRLGCQAAVKGDVILENAQ